MRSDNYAVLKSVVSSFMRNEKLVKSMSKMFIKDEISKERETYLYSLSKLIMETNFVNLETRKYLSNYYITIEGVTEELSKKSGKEYNFNTVKSKIEYGIKKIIRSIDEKAIRDVMNYKDIDISEYKKTLDKLISTNKTITKSSILIEIDKVKEGNILNESDFELFLELISPYTIKGVRATKNMITKEMSAYYWHLLNNEENLDENEMDRLEKLKDIIEDSYIEY